MKKRTRRQKAIIRRRFFLSACALVLAAVIALIVFVVGSIIGISEKQPQKDNISKTESNSSKAEEVIPEITIDNSSLKSM